MKIKVLIFCLINILLTSCAITQNELWGSRSYKENFRYFFIDKENKKVVLLGDNDQAFKQKESYYYSINNKDDIIKVFELGAKSGYISVQSTYQEARGSEVIARKLIVRLNKKNLSNAEVNSLKNSGFMDSMNNNYIWYSYNIEIIRYRASDDKNKNKILFPLNSDNFNQIVEEKNTPLQIMGKVLLTPFAVVADILMSPFYLIGTFGMEAGSK